MRILHILGSNSFSGAEKVVMLLSQYDKENEIYIACGPTLAEIYRQKGLHATDLVVSEPLKAMKIVKEIVKKQKIDIIHAHDNKASLLALGSNNLFSLKRKVISHIHNSYPWLRKKSLYQLIDRVTRNRYDLNIYCGKTIQDYYEQYGHYIERERTKIVSNSIDFPNKTILLNKEILGIEGKFVYGFIGRLEEQKGLIPFINSIDVCREKFENCVFLIIGSGTQEQELKRRIKEKGLETYFYFIQFQQNIDSFYDVMDIFFLPSRYEGLPMVILEAMANQKIIVSMDVGSISEVIHHKQTGYLVPANNYEQFIEQLVEAREEKNQHLGRRAYELVSMEYGIQENVRKLNETYEQMVT